MGAEGFFKAMKVSVGGFAAARLSAMPRANTVWVDSGKREVCATVGAKGVRTVEGCERTTEASLVAPDAYVDVVLAAVKKSALFARGARALMKR
mmetsp:Transcript_7624/g.28058  ORF Transcript_7624/g.28058 Transcript_7624/m.28058 type:complete len:94 (-) Transcript_7624:142-423(-)